MRHSSPPVRPACWSPAAAVPIDRVISDFVAGAAEKLVLANQHHEVIVVEGQGSLFHPRYSGVTLNLPHGAMPHGLIALLRDGPHGVARNGRRCVPPLAKLIEFYEAAARLMHPCRVIGLAVNGVRFSDSTKSRPNVTAWRTSFSCRPATLTRYGPSNSWKRCGS